MKLSFVVAICLLSPVLIAKAQQPEANQTAAARVSFHFARAGLEVPEYTISIDEDGTGRYQAEVTFPAARGSIAAPASQQVDRAIALSPATRKQIFAAARALNRFNDRCASSAKNIADTGAKTLRYSGADGTGTCAYNYSEDKRVVQLTAIFQAIATTLDLGRKLDFDHRFDRLGLDSVTAELIEEMEAGRAIEVGTIAASLKSIAQDSEVLERVRSRAAKLLQQAEPTS